MRMYKHIWPPINSRVKKAVMSQLEAGEISIYDRSGIFEKFEDRFRELNGSKFALLTSSGTAAIHSAMVGIGLQPGDEVICPAYTFFATVTPIFQTGAVPVLCDARDDGNIDPDKIPGLISKRTKAVIVTHMWGSPCEMDKIVRICKKFGLKLIEDCSHAHGARFKGKPVGTFGDVGAFSLQGQKIVTGGEGGILVTNDREVYERALLLGHYNKRCKQEIAKDSPYYDYAVTGFGLKLRAHPLAITIANEGLSQLGEWHEAKVANADYLTDLLKDIPEIKTPEKRVGVEASWYAYTITIRPGTINLTAKEFCEKLIQAGVVDADLPGSTCPLNLLKLFQDPSLLYPTYKGKVNYKKGDFPIAEAFFEQTVKLPIDVKTNQAYRKVLRFYAETIRRLIKEYKV